MGSFWFLNFCLKCIDLLAWPLLALGYPMFASVRVIETDSYSETKNLISYWILLSLIYLFEYTFLKLLEWFQFWPYLKLLVVFWLVVPDFGRAFNVYNHLVRSCIYLNPQVVISRFNNWKKLFVKKENFLLQAEKYIKENGTEALEQIIADKNAKHCLEAEAINAVLAVDQKEMQQNTACSLGAEAIQAVPARERKEMPLTNGKWLHLEQKNIQDLEVIEKKEVPAGKNGNSSSSDLPLKENVSSATDTEGMAGKDGVDNELPNSSVPKKVQKEWTCAICQVTTPSEIILNGHIHGKKHKAKCEALKAMNQPTSVKFVPAGYDKKTDQSNDKSEGAESSSTSKQKNVMNQHASMEQKSPQTSIQAGDWGDSTVTDLEKLPGLQKQGQNVAMNQFNWTKCASAGWDQKTDQSNDKSERAESSTTSKQKNVMNQHASMEQKINQTSIQAGNWGDFVELPGLQKQGQNVGMNQFNWTKFVPAGSDKKTDQSDDKSERAESSSTSKQKNVTNQHASMEQKIPQTSFQASDWRDSTVTDVVKLPGLQKQVQNVGMNQFSWTCVICNVKCKSECDMAAHLNGRKHLDCIQSPAGIQRSKLTCILCNVKCTSKVDLLSHLNGRKHRERIQSPAGLGSVGIQATS